MTMKEWNKMQKEVQKRVEQGMTPAKAYEEVKKEIAFNKG